LLKERKVCISYVKILQYQITVAIRSLHKRYARNGTDNYEKLTKMSVNLH